jgi:hypothetical protein
MCINFMMIFDVFFFQRKLQGTKFICVIVLSPNHINQSYQENKFTHCNHVILSKKDTQKKNTE